MSISSLDPAVLPIAMLVGALLGFLLRRYRQSARVDRRARADLAHEEFIGMTAEERRVLAAFDTDDKDSVKRPSDE